MIKPIKICTVSVLNFTIIHEYVHVCTHVYVCVCLCLALWIRTVDDRRQFPERNCPWKLVVILISRRKWVILFSAPLLSLGTIPCRKYVSYGVSLCVTLNHEEIIPVAACKAKLGWLVQWHHWPILSGGETVTVQNVQLLSQWCVEMYLNPPLVFLHRIRCHLHYTDCPRKESPNLFTSSMPSHNYFHWR